MRLISEAENKRKRNLEFQILLRARHPTIFDQDEYFQFGIQFEDLQLKRFNLRISALKFKADFDVRIWSSLLKRVQWILVDSIHFSPPRLI